MSNLILPQKWTSQPQYPVDIDRSNPLGAKVVYASTLAGGYAYDSVAKKLGVNTAAVPKATPRGRALNFNGSSAYITLPTTNLVSGYPITVSCWFEKTTSVSQVIYSLNGSGYNAIAGYTPGNLNLSINGSSNPGNLGYPFASIPAGWNHLVVVHYSGSFTMYLNGADVTSLTKGSENWGQPAAGNHSIGQRLGGVSARWFNGGIQDFVVFRGALSAAEALQLYQAGYQIFQPPQRRIFVASAGGAAALAGNAAAQASATGSLTTAIQIAAAALSISTASAALSTAIPLSGAAASVASSNGSLTAQISLSAAALAQAIASAGLSSGIILTANAVAQAAAQGTLSTLISLIANAQGIASASASLTAGSSGLSADAQATATASASLTAQIRLSAAAVSQATATADLTTGAIPFTATALSIASASGALTTAINLAAGAVAVATVTATLFEQTTGRLGGFEYGSKVYIKRNKKIYIFDSVEEADSYIEAESKVEEIVQQSNKTSRLARKRAREKAHKLLSIEPVESVDIPALKTLVSQLQTDFELPQWIARQDWQRVVEIYNQAMEMQDEEDLLLIL